MHAFGLIFRQVGNNVLIELIERQAEHLLEVVILPVLRNFFFCLVEDLPHIHVFKLINFLECLSHKIDKLVIESGPFHIDVF